MKIFLAIKPKIKIALILLILIIIVLSGTLFERRFVSSINESNSSIYNDRLVPANEMFRLADQMLERHLLVEDFLASKGKISVVETQTLLNQNKQTIDTLLTAFETTYLVKAETESLGQLKMHLKNYTVVESSVVLSGPETEELHLLRTEFLRVHQELKTLSAIQLRIGQDLFSDSEKTMVDAHALSDFQIIIIILLCILAQIFILSSKSIASPIEQNHHLN